MVLRVEMVGTARILLDDQPPMRLRSTQRDRALAYLGYTGDWVSRDRLAFLFWPDTPDQTARHNVRQLLKRIRRLDWLTGLEVDGENVRWVVSTDVEDLRGPPRDDRPQRLPNSGILLPGIERGAGFEYEEWLLIERRRVMALWEAALLATADRAEREGRPGEAASLLEPALGEVDDQTVLVRYMDLAARAGNRGAAIAAYHMVTQRLDAQLGVGPDPEARTAFERLRDDPSIAEPQRQPTMVGRTKEVGEILAILADPACRLLTLLGPGGIGKSTLAAHIATTAAPRYRDGSLMVSLETISGPESIPSVIAAALESMLDDRLEAIDQLTSWLADRHMLLVVDNVEHLPGGWVQLSHLSRRCPELDVLVTSRERLRLEDEWVLEVDGLSPADAVELLLRRARQVAPEAVVSQDDALSIVEAVGGSPLGIELATPWLRVISPQEIVAEVVGQPSLLAAGSRDVSSRHRSVAAAMAHSWRLMSAKEREAIEALSAFVGAYTRELAEAVAGVDAALLRDLIDKSLVRHRPDGLLASHPLVRQYAASRLAGEPERRSEVRSRHAHAVLGLLDPPQQAITHLRHLDDAVEAWLHAIDSDDHVLLGRSVEGLGSLFDSVGRISQAMRLLDRAIDKLSHAPDSRSALAASMMVESALLQRLGRHEESARAAHTAVDTARDAGDDRRLVRSLISLAWARKWTEGHAAQHTTLLEALPVARSLGDDLLVTDVLRGLGCSAPTLEECRSYLTEALAHTETSEIPVLRCQVLSNLGSVLWGLGETSQAIRLHEEMLVLAREAGMARMVGQALIDLAFLNGERGDLATAARLSDEAEKMNAETDLVDRRINAAQVAGEILRQSGEDDAARARVYEGLSLAIQIGLPQFGLRSLRLHGQLLIDAGEVEEGLGMLALVCDWTERGPDFTGWILDPRAWEESTERADPVQVEAARDWARERDLAAVVAKVRDDLRPRVAAVK